MADRPTSSDSMRRLFAGAFPLGSHLCREPMPPMSEMKRDMENLKRHGFNLVKLQEHWAIDEPLEGHFDFSRYEELIAHAESLDMAVYLGVTCEQAPSWLWRKHPDCRMVGLDGRPIAYEAQATLPADGKPGPCFDHAGARADQARFLAQLVNTLGRYPRIVWNTWQEIGYWGERIVGQRVCYCEHTLSFFREWLQEKYGDLDALNRAWNTRYRDWGDLRPEHKAGSYLALEIDWRYFMDNVQIARVLQTRADAIREADPLKRPVFAHVGSPAIGSARDWTYARCQDFLGSSFYPAWSPIQSWDDAHTSGGTTLGPREGLLAEIWGGVALPGDYLRSCSPSGAPVWAAEVQGGPISDGFNLGRVPSADDIRRWMLTAVGSGVTAISFWVTRAEIMAAEANGFSLLDTEGDTTERFEEAARIGRALNAHPDLFSQFSWPGAQVAILIDERNYQSCASMPAGGRHLAYSVRGWHCLLWEAGIPVDFVATSQPDIELSAYRALILPFPFSLPEETAGKLAGYVESGGHLISEACPGRIGEHAFCNRGELSPAMRELFGVRHESLTMVREPDGGTRWSPTARTWGEYLDPTTLSGVGRLAGQVVRANVYLEAFACEGAEPCLTSSRHITGTVRRAGSGTAWLLGTVIGHAGTAYSSHEAKGFVGALMRECNVTPEHDGQLLLRRRVIPGKEARLYTNPTGSEVTEDVSIGHWQTAADLLGDSFTREGQTVTLTVPPLDVRVIILQD